MPDFAKELGGWSLLVIVVVAIAGSALSPMSQSAWLALAFLVILLFLGVRTGYRWLRPAPKSRPTEPAAEPVPRD